VNDVRLQEKEKYQKAWDFKDYRRVSPGELLIPQFLLTVKPKIQQKLVDFGAGCGRASLFFHELGFDVELMDIAENCLDEEVAKQLQDKLHVGCLWDAKDVPKGDVGYCCDVMEHIPEDKVDDVLKNIMDNCKVCFFSICVIDDAYGKKLGEPLHLTVKPYQWWRDKLKNFGHLKEARDLVQTNLFVLENNSHE